MGAGKQPKVALGTQNQRPTNFYSPLGSITTTKRSSTYTPNYQNQDQNTIQQASLGANQALAGLNKYNGLNINDYYNNPFYASTKSMLEAPIQRQYAQDQYNQSNNLNAQNLGGGSYAALQQSLLDQNRDYNLSQAEKQARESSANAYQQQFANQGALLSSNLGISNDLYNRYFNTPLQYGLHSQTINPQYANANANAFNAQTSRQQQGNSLIGPLATAAAAFL